MSDELEHRASSASGEPHGIKCPLGQQTACHGQGIVRRVELGQDTSRERGEHDDDNRYHAATQ